MSKDYADMTSESYLHRVDNVVRHLRAIADDVERQGKNIAYSGNYACGRHTEAARRVIHEITWGVANVSLDNLVQAAGEADGAASWAEIQEREQACADLHAGHSEG